jgi:hypothetical protein
MVLANPNHTQLLPELCIGELEALMVTCLRQGRGPCLVASLLLPFAVRAVILLLLLLPSSPPLLKPPSESLLLSVAVVFAAVVWAVPGLGL